MPHIQESIRPPHHAIDRFQLRQLLVRLRHRAPRSSSPSPSREIPSSRASCCSSRPRYPGSHELGEMIRQRREAFISFGRGDESLRRSRRAAPGASRTRSPSRAFISVVGVATITRLFRQSSIKSPSISTAAYKNASPGRNITTNSGDCLNWFQYALADSSRERRDLLAMPLQTHTAHIFVVAAAASRNASSAALRRSRSIARQAGSRSCPDAAVHLRSRRKSARRSRTCSPCPPAQPIAAA